MEYKLKIKEKECCHIIDDLITELANLSKLFAISQRKYEIEMSILPFETLFCELELQNDLLNYRIESLQYEKMEILRNLKDKEIQIQQLHSNIISHQAIIEQKCKKYDELKYEYVSLAYSIQKQKPRCEWRSAELIKPASVYNRKPYKLQRISEIIEKKDDEVKAFQKCSVEEKSSHINYIVKLEDQTKQLLIKLFIAEENMRKLNQELKIANENLLKYAQTIFEFMSQLTKKKENIVLSEDEYLKYLIRKILQERDEMKSTREKQKISIIIEDYEALRRYSEEQNKALAKANDAITNFEEQSIYYKNQYHEEKNRNTLLEAENTLLKNKLEGLDSIQKSLHEELQKTKRELFCTKCDLEKLHILNQNTRDLNYNVVVKYNHLVDDYNKLEEEYGKHLRIKYHIMKELEMTRTWQHKQCEQDKLIKTKMRKMEEHINTLIDDRKEVLKKLIELHRDMMIISNELIYYKGAFTDALRWKKKEWNKRNTF